MQIKKKKKKGLHLSHPRGYTVLALQSDTALCCVSLVLQHRNFHASWRFSAKVDFVTSFNQDGMIALFRSVHQL